MGYRHIENLYKDQTIMCFKECYALEKVHGTSAHVAWKDGKVHLFSGGAKHETFAALFDLSTLQEKFSATRMESFTVYGEAYGGSMQGMKGTYGDKLKFIAFEVLIGEAWLSVPRALEFASKMGFDFVPFTKIPATIEAIDKARSAPSRLAVLNGLGEGKLSEGVVLRPLEEFRDHRGNRILAKHKNEEFSERSSKRDTTVGPEKQEILSKAEAIAFEFVTPMRMEHVKDRLKATLQRDLFAHDTPAVIAAMTEDVLREGRGELIESREARKAIGSAAAKLFIKSLSDSLYASAVDSTHRATIPAPTSQ